MNLAPIILFVYNRPWHTQQTVEALQRNDLAERSDLFIFSDGPRSESEKGKVTEVREYIKLITGFKSVTTIEREQNYGLGKSIIEGVSEVINDFGQIIVLEDDMVSSPYFLKFMNEALEFYRNEPDVVCIHGYMYALRTELPETFFLRGADCWGWATWKRGWDLFERNGSLLLRKLKDNNLEMEFDIEGAYPYTKMLEDQISKRNDSWAIRWRASAFLVGKLTLYPGRSLIHNIGLDGSGRHCKRAKLYDTDVHREAISINKIPIEEDLSSLKEIKKYLLSANQSLVERVKNKLRNVVNKDKHETAT